LKISLPVLSKINHDGKHLFLSERPSLTVLANCFSGENIFVLDCNTFTLNKNVTPFYI
jgi:hypothetical protein